MIPRASIQVRLDDPNDLGGLPSRAEAQSDYLDGNREYNADLLDASWADAIAALEIERQHMSGASGTTEWSAFEDALDGELEDWEIIETYSLDLGVAAAVLALCAARCVTSTSCRGHAGQIARDWAFPKVRFYADVPRGLLVRDAAAIAECGFGVDDQGIGMIWAPSVAETLAFADEMIRRCQEFERLRLPAFA